jgi:hydroxypyruvate isomerase
MAHTAPAASESEGVPFSLSIMLWTIYRDLPFEQRLEKVAEAGYHAVELVGEFKDWKKQDFADARRKKRELRIEFDGTTGVWQPLADASAREVFLKSLREFIPTMGELECTRLIMQTGNAVPGLSDPGTGEIYYPNIFRKLGELGYSRYVAMEFMPKGETVPALRAARDMALKFGRPDKKQSSSMLHSARFYASA